MVALCRSPPSGLTFDILRFSLVAGNKHLVRPCEMLCKSRGRVVCHEDDAYDPPFELQACLANVMSSLFGPRAQAPTQAIVMPVPAGIIWEELRIVKLQRRGRRQCAT